MSKKDKITLLNIYSDITRAAVALYLNPKGTTHRMFIDHALKLLEKALEPPANAYLGQLRSLDRQIRSESLNRKEAHNLADKLLTYALLVGRGSRGGL